MRYMFNSNLYYIVNSKVELPYLSSILSVALHFDPDFFLIIIQSFNIVNYLIKYKLCLCVLTVLRRSCVYLYLSIYLYIC